VFWAKSVIPQPLKLQFVLCFFSGFAIQGDRRVHCALSSALKHAKEESTEGYTEI
jgi:hypothetical protein